MARRNDHYFHIQNTSLISFTDLVVRQSVRYKSRLSERLTLPGELVSFSKSNASFKNVNKAKHLWGKNLK